MDDRLKEVLARGRELYESRDFPAAEKLLEEVAATGAPYADVYDMLGVIAHGRGDVATAEERFRRAITINPAYTEALLNLAITLNDRRRYDEAREIFDRLSKKTPRGETDIEPFARGKLANMHADLGQAYADLGNLDEAIEQMVKAVRLCPSFADLRTKLGVLYRDAGRFEEARVELTGAVTANPKYGRAHVLLGSTILSLGDREGARAAWQKALEIDPDNQRAASFLRMLDGVHSQRLRPGVVVAGHVETGAKLHVRCGVVIAADLARPGHGHSPHEVVIPRHRERALDDCLPRPRALQHAMVPAHQ